MVNEKGKIIPRKVEASTTLNKINTHTIENSEIIGDAGKVFKIDIIFPLV